MLFWVMAVTQMAVAPSAISRPAPAAMGQTADTVVVKMVNKNASSYAFEPANVTLHPGDVLEFQQTGAVPHDVAFTKTPAGAKISSIKVGPFLTAKGQTYDLVIDGRFPPGHYAYDCLPHAALGMKGTFDVVTAAPTSQTSGK